tara:strand:+ start:631 stop:1059 length:429 start_codon:yes stop_codon:yes gene_type:complete
MITVNNAFHKFSNKIRTNPSNKSLKKMLDILDQGIEIEITEGNGNILVGILFINNSGEILLCKQHKNSVFKKEKFSYIECSSCNDKLYLTLFNTSNNEIFCKIKFNIIRSAEIFKEKYNLLVDLYKKTEKISLSKRDYFKLD